MTEINNYIYLKGIAPMTIVRLLEEMAKISVIEKKISEISERNADFKDAFNNNDINAVRKLISSQESYPNEVDVVYFD